MLERAGVRRADGRRPPELRRVSIQPGFLPDAEGSALIEMGGTHVICTATVQEAVPPFLRGRGTGWVTAEYGMLPRSSPERIERERRGPGGRTHEIQRLIGRSLRAVTHLGALGERSILVDCDVLRADGGTRCASITGGFVALALALARLVREGAIGRLALTDSVAAVSVGLVDGRPLLDLPYEEDHRAAVDLNLVMTGGGRFVEVQGTAERDPFTERQLGKLMDLGRAGIARLTALQRRTLRAAGVRLPAAR